MKDIFNASTGVPVRVGWIKDKVPEPAFEEEFFKNINAMVITKKKTINAGKYLFMYFSSLFFLSAYTHHIT